MAENGDQVATKRIAGGRPKDLKAVTVTMTTLWCYREHKFPEGDKRRECHLGLKALDLNICPNCIWFGNVPGPQKKLLTGAEAMIIASALRTLRETHDPMVAHEPPPDIRLPNELTAPEAP